LLLRFSSVFFLLSDLGGGGIRRFLFPPHALDWRLRHLLYNLLLFDLVGTEDSQGRRRPGLALLRPGSCQQHAAAGQQHAAVVSVVTRPAKRSVTNHSSAFWVR
jgi:hypothetical protein